jgi:hypothetical protein
MRKSTRIILGLSALGINTLLFAANLQATAEMPWRQCECIAPPSNCCTVRANECNGCVVNPDPQ